MEVELVPLKSSLLQQVGHCNVEPGGLRLAPQVLRPLDETAYHHYHKSKESPWDLLGNPHLHCLHCGQRSARCIPRIQLLQPSSFTVRISFPNATSPPSIQAILALAPNLGYMAVSQSALQGGRGKTLLERCRKRQGGALPAIDAVLNAVHTAPFM